MPQKTEDAFSAGRVMSHTEAQLAILYLLSRLPSVTDANLLDFLTEARLMNYLDMMPALQRLTQEGAVREEAEGIHRLYTLTPAGEDTLTMYASRLPYSVREAIDAHVDGWRNLLRVQRDYQAEMAETSLGDYEVSLRMMERGRAVMAVTLTLPSSDMAAKICRQWRRKGGEIFSTLLQPLMEEDE